MPARKYRIKCRFQSTLPRGSDLNTQTQWETGRNFNPRSLAGATPERSNVIHDYHISIHAPSRERPSAPIPGRRDILTFQSTLPRGSDHQTNAANISSTTNFNPRSLAGATNCNQLLTPKFYISIHAPLRERPLLLSPCQSIHRISIHVPSRERLVDKIFLSEILAFQSTLPCWSDCAALYTA